MAVNQITAGLIAVKMGAVAVDGGMGTVLTEMGYIRENTLTLVGEKPTKNEFRAEGVSLPVYVKKTAGPLVIAMTLMSPDPAQLVSVLGGTITGTAPNRVYKAPLGVPTIIQSVSIEPQDGFSGIDIPKGDLSANINAGFGPDGLFQVEVEITALQPDKAGEPPYSIRE